MSIDKLIAKSKDIGGIYVSRLLPQAKHRTIGAWCFLDHAGPAELEEDDGGMQVGAHPHTNLQTFTWMISGEVWHQDSLGNQQLIRPKQVNLMTAGTGDERGIAHTEQSASGATELHAIQMWIALPIEQDIEASFIHYPELPEWNEDGVEYILTTGNFAGRSAPTLQYSPLLGLDIKTNKNKELTFDMQENWQYGILIVAGEIEVEGHKYQANELAVISDCPEKKFTVKINENSHLMLLGGEPLNYKPQMWWNFVADNRESLQKAVADWNSGHPRFGKEIDLNGSALKRISSPIMP